MRSRARRSLAVWQISSSATTTEQLPGPASRRWFRPSPGIRSIDRRRDKPMTTTQRPEVGQSIEANGIRTNYLEAGSGNTAVVLIHGSGPGVTAYSNWRLVL